MNALKNIQKLHSKINYTHCYMWCSHGGLHKIPLDMPVMCVIVCGLKLIWNGLVAIIRILNSSTKMFQIFVCALVCDVFIYNTLKRVRSTFCSCKLKMINFCFQINNNQTILTTPDGRSGDALQPTSIITQLLSF